MMKRTVCLIFIILGVAWAAFAAEQDLKNTTPKRSPALISPQFSDMLKAGSVPIQPSTGATERNLLLAQTESDELSHTALSSALQQKDESYYIKTGAAKPIYDEDFRDFIDYRADVSLGVAKKLTDKLTVTASIGVVMMTGKWSIKGNRQSITNAAEEWPAGTNFEPYDDITPGDLNNSDYGTSYIGNGEAVITSSENLKNVDVDTTLYLFPVTLGALYRLHEGGGKFNPYVGGGIGFCMAERSTDSKALKEKYFEGPEYGIKLNDSQTITGMLLQFIAGFDVPLRKNLTLVAEASTTLYDLQSFDPILEVSYQKKSPAPFDASDITTFSYEEPLKIGVFKEEFVTNLSIGLVMPF